MEAETEALHLGGSPGSVEVDGGFAKVAGNSCEEKQNLKRTTCPTARKNNERILAPPSAT